MIKNNKTIITITLCIIFFNGHYLMNILFLIKLFLFEVLNNSNIYVSK